MTIKLIKNLILTFLLLANSSAFCYTLSNNELQSKIQIQVKNEVIEQLKSYSFINQNDIKISITGVPYNEIVTNDNSTPQVIIQSQNKIFQKNSPKRVIIKDLSGSVVKTFPINVQTLVYGDVLTAKNTINYNEEITANNTQIEKKEISNYLTKVMVKVENNTISKRNYPKGSIILADSIKQKSVILKDSIVDIIFLSNNGLMIKLQGRALKEGSIGDTISVRSDKYNKIYSAKVNSPNEVIVKI